MNLIFKKDKNIFSQQEFKLLFDENFEKLRDYIYYKCGDIEQAEDIAQETFLKLWEKREKVKKDTVLSYLFRIAHNIFVNHVKREQIVFNFQNQHSSQFVDNESPEYKMEFKQFDDKLQIALAELPEPIRVTFLMNRIDGLKYKEIAVLLDISIKTVEKRIQKAVILLKELLDHKL